MIFKDILLGPCFPSHVVVCQSRTNSWQRIVDTPLTCVAGHFLAIRCSTMAMPSYHWYKFCHWIKHWRTCTHGTVTWYTAAQGCLWALPYTWAITAEADNVCDSPSQPSLLVPAPRSASRFLQHSFCQTHTSSLFFFNSHLRYYLSQEQFSSFPPIPSPHYSVNFSGWHLLPV